ncbi:MAG: response regulator [Burkholderiales bacterium]
MAVPVAMDKINILMVDDQPAKLLSYEAMLTGLNENLIKASTAREALSCLLRHDVAVVLMDVNMPDVDGFELAQLIRQHPRCEKTAILFVSAIHLTDLDRLRGYQTGAVDYVSVPVVPEILRAKIGVFVDLYRKTAQLERLNRTLEDRVSARTAELEDSVAQLKVSERRLRQQGEALAEADRRKNEFLAMLAHELRNPLQPIRMAIELMRSPATPADRRDWAYVVIERQVSQLVRLVDDLLDASRITSGKLSLRKDRVDLAGVVSAAVDAQRPSAEARQQQLSVTVPQEPVWIHGDAMRLTQVFQNIINNAIKFTPTRGHVTVTLSAHDGARVTIRDDGAGMEAGELARVFDIFYQAHPQPDEAQGGLGIGLALVRQLVELHGGTVEARSDGRGRGSEFTVRMPLVDAPETGVPAKQDAAPATPPTARRILVVDDNRDAAESLALMLRLVGNEVDTVYDGEQAVTAVSSFRPDVVLMDLGMPRLDGLGAARAIRENPHASAVVLVAITGWGDDSDRRMSREAGFDRHLVKPVVPSELLALLSSLDARAA